MGTWKNLQKGVTAYECLSERVLNLQWRRNKMVTKANVTII